jgi:hypothetical protein
MALAKGSAEDASRAGKVSILTIAREARSDRSSMAVVLLGTVLA